MSESIGKKLNRVRKPRPFNPHLVELSFVLGIVGDFSGTSVKPHNTLAQRKFLSIDREIANTRGAVAKAQRVLQQAISALAKAKQDDASDKNNRAKKN